METAAQVAFAFGDFRLLQQRQSASACSDEDELGRHGRGPAVIGVLDRHAPAPVLLAVEANNLAIVVNVKAGLIGQVFDKQVGQRAIVDVAAGDHAGGRERLFVIPPVHDERRPGGDFAAVLAVFHAVITMVRGHLFEALAQERDIARAPDEAHMRARVDERPRVGDRALGDQE